MKTLKFDTEKTYGKFKLLNATNGGPWHKRHANDQYRSNFEDYKKARIPYSRNHDSNLGSSIYGGPYTMDITSVFPNFDADETNPESYDFACTDEAILVSLEAGTKTFFRLGQSIEHQIKKHGTIPPKDFHKWARICEHIIRHLTEGWGDGLRLDMPYWEIWNEPDIDPDGAANKKMWGGTTAQFFDFYEIAAKHLKSCFPHLKIGGPALCGNFKWGEKFLCEMHKRNVPIDFFSWHIYCMEPAEMVKCANTARSLLDKYGYENAESILNEWNYIKDWTDKYVYSIESITGLKGASFTAACITEAQKTSIDMLMYYDTRQSVFCGIFDFYTCRPLKGYYALYWYGMFYDMENEIRCEEKIENLYTLSGIDKNGKTLTMITNYSDNDNGDSIDFRLDFGKDSEYEIYLVDKEHNGELIKTAKDLTFNLPIHAMLLVKEK